MANYDLIIKLKNVADNIRNIENVAGSTLVRNIRSEARKNFGEGQSGYPYEFHNSFQDDKTVFYKESEKEVHVHHPAAKVLEWGIGSTTITAKKGEYMRFKGKDGEDVYVKEVHIAPKKPVGYVAAAIRETKADLMKQFKNIQDITVIARERE